jgi:hypothetical protein
MGAGIFADFLDEGIHVLAVELGVQDFLGIGVEDVRDFLLDEGFDEFVEGVELFGLGNLFAAPWIEQGFDGGFEFGWDVNGEAQFAIVAGVDGDLVGLPWFFENGIAEFFAGEGGDLHDVLAGAELVAFEVGAGAVALAALEAAQCDAVGFAGAGAVDLIVGPGVFFVRGLDAHDFFFGAFLALGEGAGVELGGIHEFPRDGGLRCGGEAEGDFIFEDETEGGGFAEFAAFITAVAGDGELIAVCRVNGDFYDSFLRGSEACGVGD